MKALISGCGHYRYWLTRPSETLYPDRGTALFVMLNPSTADHTEDDPTIRRCRGFARTWGCAGLTVANLYALRSTNPAGLWSNGDPVGPDNDRHLESLLREYTDVVCAWGANARADRVAEFCELVSRTNARLWCLGTTKAGAPRHPLYVKSTQPLIEWAPPAESK